MMLNSNLSKINVFSNIKIILSIILLAAIILLFLLWKNASNELKATCKLLSVAETNIQELQLENAKLLEYNTKKQEEIKRIEKEYNKLLNSAPTDSCGDAKPSLELLQFLRESVYE